MNKLSADHLKRQAYVYVRQSTPGQVKNNLESQRRQYALAGRARSLGFTEVEVIDEDLGCTGDGAHRPGFERLLAALCEGRVGGVFCIEASRLARSGRDWHTLLEFCRLVNTLLVDENEIYDLRQTNDRMLLGMKGMMSEMELATLRERSYEALLQKARRGELLTSVPIGYIRATDSRIELDPDLRIRKAIALVFRRFQEYGSARQVLLWLREEGVELPASAYGAEGRYVVWRLPIYNAVLKILRNPTYAGAYVYGRTKTVVHLSEGRKCSVKGHRVSPADWKVFIPAHHKGFISWEEYQLNQRQLADNAAMKGAVVRGPAREGGALLTGLLRCGHCGRKLRVTYSSRDVRQVRYSCQDRSVNHGKGQCIAFGGAKADQLVSEELLRRLEPLGVQAALEAIDRYCQSGDERLAQKELALEQARFEVARARRQYDAVDPDNRLVCAELERRWNETLKRYSAVEEELNALRDEHPQVMSEVTRKKLLLLGQDLPALWHHAQSPPQIKKRIVRTLLREIVVKKEGEKISMVLHWQGGDHTAIEFLRNKPGQHRHATPTDVVELIRQLARVQPDAAIVNILNRLGVRTGCGNTWVESRLRGFRSDHSIPVYVPGERLARGELTLDEAAELLGVYPESVRRLIARKELPAQQPCKGAPWIIKRADVEKLAVERARTSPHTKTRDQLSFKLQ